MAGRHAGPHDLTRLQKLVERADAAVPLHEAYERRDHWPERFIALRHDMDQDIENAVRMARWEASHGWRSTYFVLHTDWYWGSRGPARPSRLVLKALEEIASLGHEIGVHNNAVAAGLRTGREAPAILDDVLTALRRAGFTIMGTAAHGDPLARNLRFVNYEMFRECPNPDGLAADRTITYGDGKAGTAHAMQLRQIAMSDIGLEYEAYFIGQTMYLSDSEGHWNQNPDDLHERFVREGGYLQLLTHPVHWALQGELVRPIPVVTPPTGHDGLDPERGDSSRPPYPILVRGDCCSRRAILMNQDLFGGHPVMTRDEKSRADFILDHLTVGSPTTEQLDRYIDLDRLTGSHHDYALAQATRDTLGVTQASLIVMDSYADMNFKAWRHRQEGWKLWIYPAYVRDQHAFDRDFEPVDFLSLEEAVELNVRLIERYRSQVGDVPVLYLQQPIAYYHKLDHRAAFRNLGAEIAKRVPDVYVGDVDDSQLVPADMNSSGPGQTLHFNGLTYRKMIQAALDQGLREWLEPNRHPIPA
ncbi:MAG: hypothetical protein ACHQZR_05955 [Candidatus Limnocylindrales bacterium]